MSDCCYNNTPSYAGCTSVFGCSGNFGCHGSCGCGCSRVVYGPTGPMGPAATAVPRSYAQFTTPTQTINNGDVYPMTELISDPTGNINGAGNTITLRPGKYHISYIVCTDGGASGNYKVTPELNNVSMPIYEAREMALACGPSSVSGSFVIDVQYPSTLRLRAAQSAGSMNQSTSMSVVKID